MCVCVCAHVCGASFSARASSLMGGAWQDNQVFEGARCQWGIAVALGQAAEPWRRGVGPGRREVKGKRVAIANGKVLLRPDLLWDEPLVIST